MLQAKLKSLVISMKLFGLHHLIHTSEVEPTQIEGVKPKPKRKHMVSIFSLKTYSFIVMLLTWANFLRCIPGLFPIDSTVTLRIILFMWFTLVACSSTIMVVASEKSSHLPSFYKHWNAMYEGAMSVGMDIDEKMLFRSTIIATIVGWIIALTNVVGVIYLDTLPNIGFTQDSMRPFHADNVTKAIGLVFVTLASGINVFSVMFLMTMCYIIKTCFNKLSEDVLRKRIQDGGDRIPKCLGEVRLLHIQLCDCVFVLDRTFGLLIAALFAINLPLACFLLYQFVNVQLQLVMILMYVFWMMSTVFTLTAVTIGASLVHEAAHSPLEHIFKIQGKGASMEEGLQVNLFLSQLTGRQVGFTVMGIVLVTKELLLTITGLFITYFFLLLQFKII